MEPLKRSKSLNEWNRLCFHESVSASVGGTAACQLIARPQREKEKEGEGGKERKRRKSRNIITICCQGHLPKPQTHPSQAGKHPANWEWESLVLVTFHI